MTLILLRIWPALIPLILYLVWFDLQRRKAIKAGEEPRRFREGPFGVAIITSLIIAIGALVWYGTATESRNNVAYEPARVIDGKIVRGSMTDKTEE